MVSQSRDYTLDIDTDYSFKDSVDAWLKANQLISKDKSLAPINIQHRIRHPEGDVSLSTIKTTWG